MNYPYVMKNRKSIRFPLYDYSSPGEYFITICVKDRACLLGEIFNDEIHLSAAGTVLDKWILQLKEKYPLIEVNHYGIMPNHFHLIIEIKEIIPETNPNDYANSDEPTIVKRRKMLLSKAIGYLKMNSAKEINLLQNTSDSSFWQGNYFERIIRDAAEYDKVVNYIHSNPLNWNNDLENT